jgi:hypothetical protein
MKREFELIQRVVKSCIFPITRVKTHVILLLVREVPGHGYLILNAEAIPRHVAGDTGNVAFSKYLTDEGCRVVNETFDNHLKTMQQNIFGMTTIQVYGTAVGINAPIVFGDVYKQVKETLALAASGGRDLWTGLVNTGGMDKEVLKLLPEFDTDSVNESKKKIKALKMLLAKRLEKKM